MLCGFRCESARLRSALRTVTLVAAFLGLVGAGAAARAQLTQTADMIFDPAGLLMPRGSTYGRSVNGNAFQTEALLTYNGYQYVSWYHQGLNDEDVYIARRDLTGNTWQLLDTVKNFDNGDATAWDAHNVISIGVSGDGRIHFSWDMHNQTLRYLNTTPGVVTNPAGTTWITSIFNAERSSLNSGGSPISDVTYPQFITKANGDMIFNYRTGSSGSGNVWMTTYRTATGLFDAPHQIIDGTATGVSYSDPYGTTSTDRNAYINGMNIDGTGRIHMSWVWRETATGGSNHDISYAYSDDGGDTWLNNAGVVVGTIANPITMEAQVGNNSKGLIVVPMDRGNTLMNQQAQTADNFGGVHMVMWHKTDDAPKQTGFTTTPAAYFHYFRDPATGQWTRNSLPTVRADGVTPLVVGARPDVAYDGDGNLYAAYTSPGPGDGAGVTANYYAEGDLIVATASRALGYQDWHIVSTDTRDWAGEPHIDQARLLQGGTLSIIMQENSDANTGVVATPMHVIEYAKLAKHLVWAGDNTGTWTNDAGTDWDFDNNNTGDSAFSAGNRVTFDDGAVAANVNIAAPVSTSGMSFRNTAVKSYTFTGSPISGPGGLSLDGVGTVTLANGANAYTGATAINKGKLVLSGSATLPNTPTITVAAGATLDATAATAGLPLNNQVLTINGHVDGNIVATSSAITLNSATPITGNVTATTSTVVGIGTIAGNLSAPSGSLVRVGASGIPSSQQTPTTVIDDFADADLSQYTKTVVLDSGATEVNVGFSSPSGTLSANYTTATANNITEQVMFLRNDVSLPVGSTLVADLAMPTTTQLMDLGLAVSTTATPTASSGGSDTRNTFNWASVSARPSQDAIRVNRSINGTVDTNTGTIGTVTETTVSQLYIRRNSITQFVVGYTNASGVKTDASTINFTVTNVGAAIGFYTDLRASGSLGAFDNLRIIGAPVTVYSGQTLTVQGDVALGGGSTLALDIFSPAITDKLAVGGNLLAGGALDIDLNAAAPAPALGDSFHILDFATASSTFDSYSLPSLGAGLAWNLSKLLTLGNLDVVNDVDLDNNGLVDGSDFILLQQTNPSLTSAWTALFGSRLSTPGEVSLAAVPEPASATLVALALCGLAAVRRRAK